MVVDNPKIFKSFGDELNAPKPTYKQGDSISVTFVGANPRNNFRLGQTFAAVENFNYSTKTWQQVRDDSDWSLLYEWERTSTVLGTSEVTITWESMWETGAWKNYQKFVPSHGDLLARQGQLQGLYRVRYYGDSKALGGKITAFEGTSSEFRIE